MPLIRYRNERPEAALVVVEPWAQAISIEPGRSVEIEFEVAGVANPQIFINHRPDGEIEIGAWVDVTAIRDETTTYLTIPGASLTSPDPEARI